MEALQHLDISSWLSFILNDVVSLPSHSSGARDWTLQTAIILDVMWYARNQVVHCDAVFHPSDLIANMKRHFVEHRAAWRDFDMRQHFVWKPPDLGSWMFNCDAAVRGNMSFLATVARDDQGCLKGAWSDFLLSPNPLLAEFHAIRLACQSAESSQICSVIFKSDSLCSCRIINDPTFLVEGPLLFHATLIRDFLRRHLDWRLNWISRKQNFMAHRLAAWTASSFVFDVLSISCLPLYVTSADDPLDPP
ncbi:hypothetical protein CJ030_MR5G011901 [Morella rubra]|uniref:RNase H type-1 domain-containing protein n=1 Tax=Morella rubra TaxID=262757 RepID=A0A6A1VIZ4_9ROSI|nr:hypothetical protein CJ030_MR5G011901 [Morella rubra]